METLKEEQVEFGNSNGRNISFSKGSPKIFDLVKFFTTTRSSSDAAGVLPEVRKWVALEERIIHDYRGRSVVSDVAEVLPEVRKWVALEERIVHDYGGRSIPDAAGVLPEVKKWVALEERIIHNYHEKEAAPEVVRPVPSRRSFSGIAPRTVLPERVVPKIRVKIRPPVKEAPRTSQQSIAYSAVFKKETAPSVSKASSRGRSLLLIAGWLAAGFVVSLLAGEISSHRETSLKFAQVWGEHKQLEKFYNELQATLSDRESEVRRLNGQVRDLTGELRAVQQKMLLSGSKESAYREELVRVTAHYEAQLEATRGLLRNQENLIRTLQSQASSMKNQIGKKDLAAAIAPVLERLEIRPEMRELPSSETAVGTPLSGTSVQGRVIMVNAQYHFVIVDIGSDQGVREGRTAEIFRNGVKWTSGKVERVYPSMSTVTVLDSSASSDLREGDIVSLS
ncbi:MAG TPA: hypothetical protein PLL75_03270 [Candidatus Omnitrophota bacterium]|nr:hypothetical protein [Candidatus Omnitrophota bacterium]HPS36733.1 hypothetical protein [Candidatus Omnitrophota bacterium]